MKKSNGWGWVPTLYFAEGLPYVIVMNVAVAMYARLGISNSDIALYTSYLYLPWVIKPLWSPIVDMFKSKRWWIIAMQIVIGGGLAGVAMLLPAPNFFRYTLAFFWLLAFASATHDIAADGFYMLGLNQERQAYFVGIRNTFYRLAVIAGQGGVVMIAGMLEKRYFAIEPQALYYPEGWAVAIGVTAVLFILIALLHMRTLPRPSADSMRLTGPMGEASFIKIFAEFFKKPGIVVALLFILLFRFAEAQLVKISSPFLLDKVQNGGLGLETTQVGFIYGTLGVLALTVGGILGGIAISKKGLNYWMWPMTIAMNIPNLVYLWMAWALPESSVAISTCVCIEQLGYGFGFTALTCFMLQFSQGKNATANYSLCTGFMALGMMLPGMMSGYIQENIGYIGFFQWIMISTIPAFIITAFAKKQLK